MVLPRCAVATRAMSSRNGQSEATIASVEVRGEAGREWASLPTGEPGQGGGVAGALHLEAREQPVGDGVGVGGGAEARPNALDGALPVAQRRQPGRAGEQDPQV